MEASRVVRGWDGDGDDVLHGMRMNGWMDVCMYVSSMNHKCNYVYITPWPHV